jgi:predicted amidophosphoribosyltransferase
MFIFKKMHQTFFNSIFEELILKFSSIKRISKIVFRIPKNCVLCESWVLFKAPLCKGCRKFLYNEYKKNEFRILNIDNYPCCYLWEWNKQNHLWIQKVVLSMKDGNNFELYKLFMPWLLKKTKINHLRLSSALNVLAIPSLDRKHPLALVNSFTEIKPGINIIKIIKKDHKSQKFKSRSERLDARFAFEDRFISPKSITKLVVLDDVISTGGSFRGVLILLGRNRVQMAAVWAYKVSGSNYRETF